MWISIIIVIFLMFQGPLEFRKKTDGTLLPTDTYLVAFFKNMIPLLKKLGFLRGMNLYHNFVWKKFLLPLFNTLPKKVLFIKLRKNATFLFGVLSWVTFLFISVILIKDVVLELTGDD
jgi:hypothetical protein